MTFGLIIAVMMIIVCVIVTVTYFDHSEKAVTKPELFVLFSSVCHFILFAVLAANKDFQWLLFVIQFLFSSWMLINFLYHKPYYDWKTEKANEVTYAVYFWGVLLCVFARVKYSLFKLQYLNILVNIRRRL